MIVYNEYPTPKALYVALNNTITYNTSNTSTVEDNSTKYYKLSFSDGITGVSKTDLRTT